MHPFVVVIEFDKETGDSILVSFSRTSGKNYEYDSTTIVPGGIHEFIPKESYAAYYMADRMSNASLEEKITNGEAVQGTSMNRVMVERLRAGLLASRHTPPTIKDFYRDCLFRRLNS